MADDRRITNIEAFERYVAKFKSNTEAARRFVLDEGLDNGTDELGVLNRWAYRIRSLKIKWARLSEGQKSDCTKKAFLEFQQRAPLYPTVLITTVFEVVLVSNQLLLEVQMMETKWLVCKMKRVPVKSLHSTS